MNYIIFEPGTCVPRNVPKSVKYNESAFRIESIRLLNQKYFCYRDHPIRIIPRWELKLKQLLHHQIQKTSQSKEGVILKFCTAQICSGTGIDYNV